MKTGTKLLTEHKTAGASEKDNKSKNSPTDSDRPFYPLLEEALSDILSAAEIRSFIQNMKKGQSEITELINLEDLNSALATAK